MSPLAMAARHRPAPGNAPRVATNAAHVESDRDITKQRAFAPAYHLRTATGVRHVIYTGRYRTGRCRRQFIMYRSVALSFPRRSALWPQHHIGRHHLLELSQGGARTGLNGHPLQRGVEILAERLWCYSLRQFTCLPRLFEAAYHAACDEARRAITPFLPTLSLVKCCWWSRLTGYLTSPPRTGSDCAA